MVPNDLNFDQVQEFVAPLTSDWSLWPLIRSEQMTQQFTRAKLLTFLVKLFQLVL